MTRIVFVSQCPIAPHVPSPYHVKSQALNQALNQAPNQALNQALNQTPDQTPDLVENSSLS